MFKHISFVGSEEIRINAFSLVEHLHQFHRIFLQTPSFLDRTFQVAIKMQINFLCNTASRCIVSPRFFLRKGIHLHVRIAESDQIIELTASAFKGCLHTIFYRGNALDKFQLQFQFQCSVVDTLIAAIGHQYCFFQVIAGSLHSR